MSTRRKIQRAQEIRETKKAIKDLKESLELSNTAYKSLNVRVTGKGLNYGESVIGHRSQMSLEKDDKKKIKMKVVRQKSGHKPSLKSQFSFLLNVYKEKLEDQKLLEEIKKKIDEKNETEKQNGTEE